MFPAVVVYVVNSEELWFCFATALAPVATISHNCFVSLASPIFTPSTAFGFNKSGVFALLPVGFALIGPLLVPILGIPLTHIFSVTWAAYPLALIG